MLENIIKNKDISMGAKAIYVYLELISKNREVRDKSVRIIGGEVGIAHQTVCKHLRELQEADLIDRETIHPKVPQVIRLKAREVENIEC